MGRLVPVVSILILVAACGGTATDTTTPPPAPEPSAEPEPIDTTPAMQSRLDAPQEDPVESGFNHCCGNSEFRLQIRCEDRLMRCYERNRRGRWNQTYGRHCKRELTDNCYLEGCSPSCD